MRMLQSGCNHLKWVLSQHPTKQFRMFAQVHFSKSFFLGKICYFTVLRQWKKLNTEISCKWNRLDFRKLRKCLQNFVNVGRRGSPTEVTEPIPGKCFNKQTTVWTHSKVWIKSNWQANLLGRVAQSVTCLATDACLTAIQGSRVRSRPGPILSWRLVMK